MDSRESDLFHALVEKLAYQFWEERGRPSGSPEVDWLRAERELRHHLGPSDPLLPGSAAPPRLSSVSMEPIEE